MSFFKKLFGQDSSSENNGNTNFPYMLGRYNGSMKSKSALDAWYRALDEYKAEKFVTACCSTLDYITDEHSKNISYTRSGDDVQFTLQQGSALLKGKITPEKVYVSADLATMKTPSVSVMRRLLERNFSFNYARTALDENRLYMMFDSETKSCNPNKLYSALSELALKADQMDEVLVADFQSLEAAEDSHVIPLDEKELNIRYAYFNTLIDETLKQIEPLNKDSYCGTISYLLLTLICRIDYFITPSGKLMADLEDIYNIYWKNKDGLPIIEVNLRIVNEIQKLLKPLSKEEFAKNVYKTVATFSLTPIMGQQNFIDAVDKNTKESQWYIQNKHPEIAPIIVEYTIANACYGNTLPDVVSELAQLFMMANHPSFCEAVAPDFVYYNKNTDKVSADKIQTKMREIIQRYKTQYPKIEFNLSKVNFDSLYKFNVSFLTEMTFINLSTN